MFKNKKEEALGGNYKIKSIKVFGSKENLYQNVKKYRKVYDVSECRYLYCEVSLYNKLFDEIDWEANLMFLCFDQDTNTEICRLPRAVEISKDRNILYIREGWGTPDPGWWKKGSYRWDVFINDQAVGSEEFHIIDRGLVSQTENPYFRINEIRLYESGKEPLKMGERVYLKTFPQALSKFVNIELRLENFLKNEDFFPLELQFYLYNDAGQQKGYMSYFKEIKDKPSEIILDTYYGAEKPGYWYIDKYIIEVVFMDQLIAVVPFQVAHLPEEHNAPLPFTTSIEQAAAATHSSIAPPISFEEAKADLDRLIGLDTVKEKINELATYLKFLQIRKDKGLDDDQGYSLHSVFTGNPGTGKTTVANLLGQIYFSLNLLSHGKVLEVGRAELVGEFVGQTAPKVKAVIEKARGGILFIDEAYSLSNRGKDGKDFGKEVIEVLIKELSDGKGDLAIILAGYPKPMQELMTSNPGIGSRLRNIIHFPDYSPDELMEIAKYTAEKRGVNLEEDAETLIYKKLVEVYRNRDEHFGNARYINGIIEEAKQNMALRLMKNSSEVGEMDDTMLSNINVKDIEKVFRHGADDTVLLPIDNALLKDTLTQLHELVGLDNIKREVDEMTKLVRYYREIGKDIRKAFSLHTVFTGNPGTGKTTIARLLVQIYKALGILERGHLVECDRKNLVAGHVGQTAIKTSEMIDKAMGGGLFIDEAYSLTQGSSNDFGREAIETILKRMEDHRGEFMIIVAGYPEEMNQFIEANPGLMSRFDKQFEFGDYKADELLSIAHLMFEKENLILDDEAKAHLTVYIKKLLDNKHKYFGNARTIRKIVVETIRHQNLRMADIPSAERTSELMKTIILKDISNFRIMEESLEPKRSIGFGQRDE